MTIFSTSSSRQILEDFSFRTWSGSRLIFGGYAAYAFEQEMNGPTWVQPAGRGPLETQIQAGNRGYQVTWFAISKTQHLGENPTKCGVIFESFFCFSC